MVMAFAVQFTEPVHRKGMTLPTTSSSFQIWPATDMPVELAEYLREEILGDLAADRDASYYPGFNRDGSEGGFLAETGAGDYVVYVAEGYGTTWFRDGREARLFWRDVMHDHNLHNPED